jgi:hypothetical protein
LTYGGEANDIEINESDKGVVVLGAGPYRIGSSVEFDWGTVNMVWGLQENGENNVSVVPQSNTTLLPIRYGPAPSTTIPFSSSGITISLE